MISPLLLVHCQSASVMLYANQTISWWFDRVCVGYGLISLVATVFCPIDQHILSQAMGGWMKPLFEPWLGKNEGGKSVPQKIASLCSQIINSFVWALSLFFVVTLGPPFVPASLPPVWCSELILECVQCDTGPLGGT